MVSDNCVLSIAEDLIKKSPMATKYCCIVMLRNKVISTGFNHYSTKFSLNTHSCILRT